jgi:hypothetical protein
MRGCRARKHEMIQPQRTGPLALQVREATRNGL